MIAKVLIDIKTSSINFNYSYNVPSIMEEKIKLGTRVIVPFNNALRLGFVVFIEDGFVENYLEIASVIDDEPFLTSEFFYLADEIAKNTFSPKNIVYLSLMPSLLFLNYFKEVKLLKKELLPFDMVNVFNQKNTYRLKSLSDPLLARLKYLEEKNIVSFGSIYKNKLAIQNNCYKRLEPEGFHILNDNMIEALSYFNDENDKIFFKDLKRLKIKPATIKKLLELNLIKEDYYNEKIKTDFFCNEYLKQEVVEKIFYDKKVFWLKNSNYLKTLEVIKQLYKRNDESCIYIILQTSQQVDKFYEDLGLLDDVLKYHPYIKESDKIKCLNALKNNDVRLLIGTKDIVTMSCQKTSLFICDLDYEEVSVNFDRLYYDTYSILKLKANLNNASILYIGNTPSVDLRYDIAECDILDINDSEKFVEPSLVSLREDLISSNFTYLTKLAKNTIEKNLSENKKIIIINTRKADSLYLYCKSCFKPIICSKCGHAVKYYSLNDTLMCPFCLEKHAKIKSCTSCGENKIVYSGYGIEKTYKEIKKLYKEYNIELLDDVTYTKINKTVERINKNEIDILVSTRAILKSEKLPKDSFILFINCDLDLKMPIYNAYENVYKYLLSACHKTNNQVLIQTSMEDNFILQNVTKDYNYIYDYLLNEYKLLKNPPIYDNFQLLVSSNFSYLKTYQKAFLIKEKLLKTDYDILGPIDARYYKKANYSFKITIRAEKVEYNKILEVLESEKEKGYQFKIFKYPVIL